jgi:antitoxin YefM
MRVTSTSELRKNLATELDRVVDDSTPLIVTRGRGRQPAVLVPLDYFSSWAETEHLLRSPENARRLRQSVRELEEGRGVERKLSE